MNNLQWFNPPLTLDQHNEQVRLQREAMAAIANKAGVLCPACKVEMLYNYPATVLTTDPPKQAVYCPKCRSQGWKLS